MTHARPQPSGIHTKGQTQTDLPSISVQDLTRLFEPVRIRRIEVIFSALGGLVPGKDAVLDDDEEFEEEQDEPFERVTRGRVALDNISFEAKGGECLGIVGPPLSGKSILMRILAGLAPPTSGRVVIRGRVAPALGSAMDLFPRFGRVKGTLPSYAALVGIPPRLARARFPEIMDFLGSTELAKRHVSSLSKGERWSLILTLALHVDADVVLIDGATPLDPFGTACRERLIVLKHSGVLVILTGQTVESVSWLADRVIQIESGGVVGEERIDPSYEIDPEASVDTRIPT